MKIFSCSIKNYKSIKSFNLELDGHSLVVSGPTGTGKTTAISTLWDIIEKVGEPVTHGEKKGLILLTLHDGKQKVFAKREFSEKTNTISILTSEGEKISAAQFKSWIHAQSVDPHKILNLGPLEQTKVLLSTVQLPEGVDLEKLASRRELIEQQRKTTAVQKKAFGVPTPLPEAHEIPVDQLKNELNIINTNANKINEISREINVTIESRQNTLHKLAELRRDIDFHTEKLAAKTKAIEDLNAAKDAIPVSNPDEISIKLSEALQQNNAAKEYQEYLHDCENLKDFDKLLNSYAVELDTIEEIKRDALERAVWPMPGLSVKDESIYLNGTLLENCGTSERMLVSAVLVGHAVAKSPVKVVRMDGIESMSKTDFQTMIEVFDKLGVQVLASKVIDEERSESISIEESVEPEFTVSLL